MIDPIYPAHTHRAFTLVELLVTIAIISILAVIAVSNFMEATIRSRVSRAMNDLRVASQVLELYRVDHGDYPPHRGLGIGEFGEKEDVHVLDGHGEPRSFGFRTLSLRLSTPIAYISSAAIEDPFKRGAIDTSGRSYASGDPTDMALIHHNIHQFAILQRSPGFFVDDFTEDYGYWRIVSLGPAGEYGGFGTSDLGWLYDPTNGVRSRGMIVRTQMDVVGERLQAPDDAEGD